MARLTNFNPTDHHPRLVVMRGVPGSGKTQEAWELANEAESFGLTSQVCSTDDYFWVRKPEAASGAMYQFDRSRLDEFHARNRDRVWGAMQANVDVIVVDNTNTMAWEIQPYVELAYDAVYQVEIREPCGKAWRQVQPFLGAVEPCGMMRELATLFHLRSNPVVPMPSILRMLSRWEPAERFPGELKDLLASVAAPPRTV